MTLRLQLFGSLQMGPGQHPARLALRPRAQRLLAFLLLNRHTPLPREQVAFALWPDHPEPESLATLRRALSDLRSSLPPPTVGEWIVAAGGQLRWNADAEYWLDVERFEHLIAQTTPAALHDAATIYSGDLLTAWDDEWVDSERERLRQLYVHTLRQLAAQHRSLGNYARALDFARRALAREPLSEAISRDLMVLHYESGDRAAALVVYEQLRGLLRGELGIEPMPETQALHKAILQGALAVPNGAAAEQARQPELATPLVIGRQAEMQSLANLWEQARAGAGRFAIVSGAAGIGKSYLVRSLADHARRQGGLVLLSHSLDFEQPLPYQPIVGMLRSAGAMLRHVDLAPVHRGMLGHLAPDLLGVAAGPAPQAESAAHGELRTQLFEALLQAFLALARAQPLLLVFEDIHWAASSTVDWLTYVTPHLHESRLMVVMTYRTEEIGASHELARLHARFAREGKGSALPLQPFSREAHRDLIAHLSGLERERAVPIADCLFDQTSGNPFFLYALVCGLLETGQIVAHEGRWTGPLIEDPGRCDCPVPDTLRELILDRADRLGELGRTLLRTAAVAGRVFDYEVVRRAGGWAEEEALGAIDSLLARGFVQESEQPGAFAFAHDLVRDIVYGALTGPRRAYLHRRLAETLQALQPDNAAGIAHHFAEGGDGDHARTYFLQAGDQALRLLALPDAVEHYRAAIRHWPASDTLGRARALVKLGHCQWMLTETEAALDSFEAARAAVESGDEPDDPVAVGDIERMIGRVHWELGDAAAAWPHYWRAFTLLDRAGETVELARTMSSISQMYMIASRFAEAKSWGERALDLATRLGAEGVRIHALNNVGYSSMWGSGGNPERGLATLRESLRRALELGLAHDILRAYLNIGDALRVLCRYDEARATLDDLDAYAAKVHARRYAAIARFLRLGIDWNAGEWSTALSILAGAASALRGSPAVWASTRRGQIENDLGRAGVAREELESTLPDASRIAELQTTVPHLGQLARAYIALRLEGRAADVAGEILALVDRHGAFDGDCTMPLLVICRWYASGPGAGAARDVLRHLERAERQVRSPEAVAALAEGRGALALAEEQWSEATELLRLAAARWEEIGRPYDQARALGDLGRALQAAGRPDVARESYDRGLALYEGLARRLDDRDLRRSFVGSPPVRALRAALGALAR